jgi:hypothetical protein
LRQISKNPEDQGELAGRPLAELPRVARASLREQPGARAQEAPQAFEFDCLVVGTSVRWAFFSIRTLRYFAYPHTHEFKESDLIIGRNIQELHCLSRNSGTEKKKKSAFHRLASLNRGIYARGKFDLYFVRPLKGAHEINQN